MSNLIMRFILLTSIIFANSFLAQGQDSSYIQFKRANDSALFQQFDTSLIKKEIELLRYDVLMDRSANELMFFELGFANERAYGIRVQLHSDTLDCNRHLLQHNKRQLTRVAITKVDSAFFIHLFSSPEVYLNNILDKNTSTLSHENVAFLMIKKGGKVIFEKYLLRSDFRKASNLNLHKLLLTLSKLSNQSSKH